MRNHQPNQNESKSNNNQMKKTIIYLRTSTEEQNPKNQLKDCLSINKFGEYEIIEEKVSGWKDVDRDGFNKIKKAIISNQTKDLICWDLDRLYRNRKRLIQFFEFCKIYKCKIHSYRQQWLESMNNIQPPFNEIIHNLMLQIMGWLAEDESNKKSLRVKSAVRKVKGITKSYKGNRWGRKPLTKNTINQVLELHKQGISMRQISKQVYYWDKNNNKKRVALASVHKIITEHNNSRT